MMGFLKKLYKDEAGQGLVEYGLILALIAVAVIATLQLLGGKVNDIFTEVKDSM
ncbi:MAG TPA: Flp family type IVb pilin [Syntrophomonadaceae bacterium]|nr:Flp family type IVb pilin [Syntrophomonadaceae bacterium]